MTSFLGQDLFIVTPTTATGAYHSFFCNAFLLDAGGSMLHSLFHSFYVLLGINDSILQSDNVVMLFLFQG